MKYYFLWLDRLDLPQQVYQKAFIKETKFAGLFPSFLFKYRVRIQNWTPHSSRGGFNLVVASCRDLNTDII